MVDVFFNSKLQAQASSCSAAWAVYVGEADAGKTGNEKGEFFSFFPAAAEIPADCSRTPPLEQTIDMNATCSLISSKESDSAVDGGAYVH